MRQRTGLTLAAIVATAVTACATMNVSSHVERGLDITKYHTYEWGPADALPTGDPRLDKDPFFKDHVEGAVEKSMATSAGGQASGRSALSMSTRPAISTPASGASDSTRRPMRP